MEKEEAIIIAFIISVLAGLTTAVVIAFIKMQFPDAAI